MSIPHFQIREQEPNFKGSKGKGIDLTYVTHPPQMQTSNQLGPTEPTVTTHGDCKLAPQTNTSPFTAVWPHSCKPEKTYQEITHPKIVQAR